MRIAHISDLHFGTFCWSPFQFFSKRFLGNFNFSFSRKKFFKYERLIALIPLLKEEKVTHILITGDLSVTSRRKEFRMAKRYIDLLKKEGFFVFTIPGNHDHYTRSSFRKKLFYKYFDSQFGTKCPFNLKEHKVTYMPLKDGLWLVGLDTATATSFVSSQGHFLPEIEENLEKALAEIPSHDKVILMNHFPFFDNDLPKKRLVRGPILKQLLGKYPNILLYLNGHSHRQSVADLRQSRLPILSDSGATPHSEKGACHLITLDNTNVTLDVFRFEDGWQKKDTHSFDKAMV